MKCPDIGDRVWGTNNTGYTRCMNFEDRSVSSQNRIYGYLASSDPQNRRSYYEITDLGKFAEKINRRLGHLRYED